MLVIALNVVITIIYLTCNITLDVVWLVQWIFTAVTGTSLALIDKWDLDFIRFMPLHTEFSLSLSPLYSLLIRRIFPYVNSGLIAYSQLTFDNLKDFRKIEEHTVAQLVGKPCCKSEGRRFDFRRSHKIYWILPVALWSWVWLSLWQEWVKEYLLGSKGSRYVWLTTLPLSYADCLEILWAQMYCNPRGFSRLYRDYFTCLLELKILWNLNIWGRSRAKLSLSKDFTTIKGLPVKTSYITNWRSF